jgi:hypothetical protein
MRRDQKWRKERSHFKQLSRAGRILILWPLAVLTNDSKGSPNRMSATSAMPGPTNGGPGQGLPRYDAFLSYSHRADHKLARRLQSALQRLAKPRDQPWAIRVFRDETDLTASPAAWPKIKAALDQSNYFVLLASPEAAASKWVPKELCYWLTAGGLEDSTDLPTLAVKIDRSRVPKLLIVLTGGSLSWNEQGRDFDWEATTALPRLLSRVFDSEPLWVILGTESPKAERQSMEFMQSAARLSVPIRFGDRDDLVSCPSDSISANSACRIGVSPSEWFG